VTAASWWAALAGPDEAAADQSALPEECDVAVVGAGFAGLSTAWHLVEAESSLRVAVFDAGVVGHGATGRNGGWFLPFPAVPPWLLAGSLPAERRVWALRTVTSWLGDVAEHLRVQGAPIEPAVAVIESRWWLVARNFAWMAHTATDLGLPSEAWDHATVRDRCGGSGRAALAVPAYRTQPLALAQHVAHLARRGGVTVHQGTLATAVVPGRDGVEVRTDSGTVHAGRVVVCANAYAQELVPEQSGRVVHSYMCATERLPPDIVDRLGGEAHLVAGLGPDGMTYRRVDRRRLLFGGLDVGGLAPTGVSAADPRSRSRLRALLRRSLPWLGPVEVDHEWGGPFVRSASELPTIRHDPRSPRIVWNLGYGGGGVALALASGRLVRGLVHPDLDDPTARLLRQAYARTRLPIVGLLRSQLRAFEPTV
jgi:gamma-glutamylputrescine oxidase